MAPTTTVPLCMPSRMRSGLESRRPLAVSSRLSFGSAAMISSPASTACCAASGSDSGKPKYLRRAEVSKEQSKEQSKEASKEQS